MDMDCAKFEEEILEGKRTGELDAHLEGCAACREFFAAQRRLDRILEEALPRLALSPSFRPALRRRIESESRSRFLELVPDLLNVLGASALAAAAAWYLPQLRLLSQGLGVLALAVAIGLTGAGSLAVLLRLDTAQPDD